MLANYIKFAWRNLVRDRSFSLLNLLGLSTGLASVLLIYLWVTDERQMDKFHANDEHLYQVMSHISLPDGIHTQEYTPARLAGSMAKDIPEIEYAIPVDPGYGAAWLTSGERQFKATPRYITEDFFSVFSYHLLEGNKSHLFDNPHSILLSDQLAQKLFHTTENVQGRIVRWGEGKTPYTVSGLFEHPGSNSSMQFDILFSFADYWKENAESLNEWANSSPSTYIVVKPGTDMDRLGKKLEHYLQTKASYSPLSLSLHKYSDEYLHNNYENGRQIGGRITYVHIFSLIGIFILVIACINFMNLSTAKAARRIREVGVRKVVGARRVQLVMQYLGESIWMVLLSLLFALLWVELLLPSFNLLTDKELSLHLRPGFLAAMASLVGLTGLLAGSYPALYLSGFRPVAVLKGRIPTRPGELLIRKGLVIFQFTLSVLFIGAVAVIYQQMQYIQNIRLGYNKDHILRFGNDGTINKNFSSFLTGARSIAGVVSIASANSDMMGHTSGNTEKVKWEGQTPDQKLLFDALDIDYDLTDVLQMKMVQGRSFSRSYGSDTLAMILNQTAVNAMNLNDPIGRQLTVWGNTYHIIGVAEDFHVKSVYEKVRPCFIRCIPSGNTIYVKVKGGQEQETIAALSKLYRQYNPGFPFEYRFLEDDYQKMYTAEQKVSVLARWFAGLAILISCLGLFGLAAFTARSRQKEIGIRKVIGATAQGIVVLLSADFLKLVLLSILIATPLCWWALNQWLNNFAYHIRISPWLLAATGGTVLALTLLTISYQAIRAALVNPVDSLRTE